MRKMNLTPELETHLRLMMDSFLAENANINLTALRTPEACWIGNILDSLPFLEILPKLGSLKRIMDLGTGGGFPLLPLAIALPDKAFVGLDSTKKKVDAVGRIIESSGIGNVTLFSSRAEELGHDRAHRERYDVVTARAVGEIRVLLEFSAPFVRVGGTVILWKSLHIDEELASSARAQKELNCPLRETHRYTLPGDFGERQLLIFEKKKSLRKEYPRGIGIPKLQPL